MRTPLADLSLLRPRSLREALRLLRDDGPLVPMAGCTDLYVGLNAGSLPARRFLDIWELSELRGIGRERGRLRIGALATYTDILRSRLVNRHLPMLAAAALDVGGPQVQNRGTLGGNVANGSPAGDTLPVLAVAEASVVLISAGGERRVPFASFYTGYRQSVMRADELIAALEFEALDGRQWFRKVGTRAAQAISKVVMAGLRAEPPRLALGSVAPTVVRLPQTEAALGSGAALRDAQKTLEREIAPIDDVRSTAAYRRRVAGRLLGRFWEETGA